MNKYGIRTIPPKRDAFASYPYRKCDICKTDFLIEKEHCIVFRIFDKPHRFNSLQKAVTCSEECANMYILQNMDKEEHIIDTAGYFDTESLGPR